MRRSRKARVIGTLALLGVAALPTAGHTQTARDALLRGNEAHSLADFGTAVSLLSRGLDPSVSSLDSVWVSGVHRLADALIELGRDSIAAVWLRWAVRQMPDLPIDNINFPPRVTIAIDSARAFVDMTTLDPVVEVRWVWEPTPRPDLGALLIEQDEIPINGQIESGPLLSTGVTHEVAPGSHPLLATAAGYFPARVTTEVLPGVTTVIRLRLLPTTSGFVYVNARPWGEVYLDERRIGYTPLAAHRTAPGSHRLRIERDGYLPFDTTVTVDERRRVRIGLIHLRRQNRP